MNASDNTDTVADSGEVSFRNLIGQPLDSFSRATTFDTLSAFSAEDLTSIRENAIQAIRNRQKSTGLLTTWNEDGSSWLYGQGLALHALCMEGKWNTNQPADANAQAAANLAHFLAIHQESQGFWPRAWDSNTGNIKVELEGDHTVWMGDFPWPLGALAEYYNRSGDGTVLPAISKARQFLYSLIDATGKVSTENILSGTKYEVSNYEGYAATLYALLELGDTARANLVMDYVMQNGWESDWKMWKEGPQSSRPVLLVNTWMGALAAKMGYPTESLQALSVIARLLYTNGPGSPYGFDGVGPVATWFEGTLSYIAAGGPGSSDLFTGIVPFINSDGTVPAYNDNLGAMAGIWAVNWSSLDATSWLYYAASRKTPFRYTGHDPSVFTGLIPKETKTDPVKMWFSAGALNVVSKDADRLGQTNLQLISQWGTILGTYRWNGTSAAIAITDLTGGNKLQDGIYLVRVNCRQGSFVYKLPFHHD
jgi:hypothetical protein